MTRSNCFGDLSGVKSCWGYRLKVVRIKQDLQVSLPKNVTIFTLKSLQKATNNFKTKIGQGGFSSCYKGTLENGTTVSVKVIEKDRYENSGLDFISRVKMMSSIRHRNTVEFLGCCVDGDRWIMVYEFVENSLPSLLFNPNAENVGVLSWETRASICLGVARGVEYLHMGISPSIVHRDLKPSNILVDGKFTPKISDFDIAHLIDDEDMQCYEPIAGTVGYIDPEYFRTGIFTQKADVYAFGVLLLEVITGRRAVEFLGHSYGIKLVDWVWEFWESGRLNELVDPKLNEFPKAEVMRYINVALFCVQESSNDRPSMSEVLLMLSGGYDFRKKVPRKPGSYRWSSTYDDEVKSPASGQMEITAATYDESSVEGISTIEPPKRFLSDPVIATKSKMITATKGKMIHGDEFERESDLIDFSEAEQMSHDLETELYSSIEPEISAAVSDSGPSDKTVAEPKMMMTSSQTNVPAQKDATEAEQRQASGDLESELHRMTKAEFSDLVTMSGSSQQTLVKPETTETFGLSDKNIAQPKTTSTSSQADVFVEKDAVEAAEQMQASTLLESESHRSVKPDISDSVMMSGPSLETLENPETSVQLNIYSHSEAVEGLRYQIEARQGNNFLSLPNVNVSRPISCTIEKIVEAFRGQCIRICLYGKGGSGKTTVLETLFHHPDAKYLFDQVIFVTVPRLAYKQKLQNEIIKQLSLNVENSNSEVEMAALVRLALTGKKVLLLLDDVWETMNLHEVGIPNPGPENSCSLVLASRSLDICQGLADREIEMEVLSTAEAWELFRYKAGNIVDSSEIEPYAQAISEECHGVPLIIAAVASALRMESNIMEWKLALQSFQFSDKSKVETLYLNPQIKYCYDRLNSHDMKTCFLHSALFARNNEMDISLLVDYFINEGLLGGRTVAAYKRGRDILRHLVNSALLEASDTNLMVKMHNVIRDSALTILSSGKEAYQVLVRSYLTPRLASKLEEDVQSSAESGSATKLVTRQDSSNLLSPSIHRYLTGVGSQIKETPSLEEWEQAAMLFLTDTGLSSLPVKPSCPDLVALCLQRNSCLRVIPAPFFESMCTLKILNLSKTRIKSLPESFSQLKSLQVLALRDCERLLMLPSSVGCLKSLEVLDLQGTELSHLPNTIGELASLKKLQVSFYGTVNHSEYKKLPAKFIPDGAISRLKLRELGMFVYPGDPRWTSSASNIIKEVKSLMLSTLHFHFPKVEHLDYFVDGNQSWTRSYLRKFNFIVGCDFKHAVSQVSYDAESKYSEEERCLKYVNGENVPDAVAEILSRVTAFYVDHHLSIHDLSEFGIDRLLELKLCILRDCPELLAVVDVKEQATLVLPFLEFLSINNLWNLKRIWVGHVLMGSLGRLRYLSVHGCPKLRYALSCSMLGMLYNLEELVIEDCESLEYVASEDEKITIDDATNKSVNTTGSSDPIIARSFPVLRSLKVLKLHYLPVLCRVWERCWPPLEYISIYNCPKLKNLHIEEIDTMNIKEIAADKAWWDMLDWDVSGVSRRLHDHVTQIHIDDF